MTPGFNSFGNEHGLAPARDDLAGRQRLTPQIEIAELEISRNFDSRFLPSWKNEIPGQDQQEVAEAIFNSV